MSNIIDSMLEERAAKVKAARDDKSQKEKELVSKRLEEMKSYLGEFYTFLEERYQATGEKPDFSFQWAGRRDDVTLFLHIPAMDDHKLAPISIECGSHALHPSYYDHFQKFSVRNRDYAELPEALEAARNEYESYVKEKREKRIEELEEKFVFQYHHEQKTEEEVRASYASYLMEFPDRGDEALALLNHWIEAKRKFDMDRENDRRARERREAEAKLRETIRLGYLVELSEWMKARDAIEEHNRKLAEEIQNAADISTYTAYKLTYALVAETDEDGEIEKYVETRSVYTPTEKPDTNGYYIVDGEPIGYFHPVSIKKLEVHASSGICAKKFQRGGVEIFFAPDTLDEKIPEICSGIVDLPSDNDAPDVPEEIRSYWSFYDLKRWARELLEEKSEEPEEPPF